MGAGLEGIAEFRVARPGVADAEERCVRLFVGEDISALLCPKEGDCVVCTVRRGVKVG